MKPNNNSNWSTSVASEFYGVSDWGVGYFKVADTGQLHVMAPNESDDASVSLLDIVHGLKDRGLEMPVLLRVENLLDDRITQLNEAFSAAINAAGYQNHYRGVFPIKVNQQRHVIEEITRYGKRYNHGLEAGSKAELMIALANLQGDDSYIVCNGYKDAEFIDLGLQAIRLGIKCFFVVETPHELSVIISRSKKLGIKPLIGVRLKLSAIVEGHWSSDSGDRSIFGMTSTQLINMVDELKSADMLDCLQLLHFHLGSQIPNIRNIRTGVQEACRYYVNLIEEGAPLGYLDMGGGLAVDYNGSSSNDVHSKNYRLEEYCVAMVESIQETLDPLEIPHPVILTESGRATVAYSSILLFNVLDRSDSNPITDLPALTDEDHELLHNLQAVKGNIEPRRLQECYNDALAYRDNIRELFRYGQISLRSRSWAENMFLDIAHTIVATLPKVKRIPPELVNLSESLADVYYGNLSIFQSLPDTWAIDQVFPIVPIHRLDEEPTRQATIADLTCDCDGKIDHFAGAVEETSTLSLHELRGGEEYYLGAFLVGAYQETLGDLHNLFGDTNVASVRIHSDGTFHVTQELEGDSISDVLSYVEYHPHFMREQLRAKAESAVRTGRISAAERREMLAAFDASLSGYTYYEHI